MLRFEDYWIQNTKMNVHHTSKESWEHETKNKEQQVLGMATPSFHVQDRQPTWN